MCTDSVFKLFDRDVVLFHSHRFQQLCEGGHSAGVNYLSPPPPSPSPLPVDEPPPPHQALGTPIQELVKVY